ncbi:MAG: TauD/TfdA dioxygenase family protein, partial [Hyphomicrobiaceae bacterium]
PTPAMATMLYAKEVPPYGGDTLFANMYAAYDALSPGMKTLARKLKTYNLYDKAKPRAGKMAAKVTEKDKPPEPAIHPLVRVHPETKRPALYLTETKTTRRFESLSEEESAPLLRYLLDHATRPEFTCRLRWEAGTLGLWDNRSMMHMALNDYHGHRRVMHRITIKGERTFGLEVIDARAA